MCLFLGAARRWQSLSRRGWIGASSRQGDTSVLPLSVLFPLVRCTTRARRPQGQTSRASIGRLHQSCGLTLKQPPSQIHHRRPTCPCDRCSSRRWPSTGGMARGGALVAPPRRCKAMPAGYPRTWPGPRRGDDVGAARSVRFPAQARARVCGSSGGRNAPQTPASGGSSRNLARTHRRTSLSLQAARLCQRTRYQEQPPFARGLSQTSEQQSSTADHAAKGCARRRAQAVAGAPLK